MPNGNESIKEVSNTIKLDTVHPFKRNLVIGIGVTILSCLSALIGSLLTFRYTFDPTILINTPGTHPQNGLGWFRIIEMLYPGIWEEVVFRGLILTLLLKKYPDKKAAIISSLAFGIEHFHNLIGAQLTASNILFTCAQVVNATSLGYVLAYIYLKTESLFPGIVFHYLYDVLFLLVGNIPIAEINLLYGSFLLITFITIVPIVVNVKFTKYILRHEKKG
ncbi:MAG: CPBP family intramembrane metalloprotease [archaeon]|nr:CPBP family intramembrane metalloprotease [archaeon]